jgi:hypothetical protein
LSGIPFDKLQKRKKQSELALRAMRDIQNRKPGGSFPWFLLLAALIIVIVIVLAVIRIYF